MSETRTTRQRIDDSRAVIDRALEDLAEALRQGRPQELADYLRFARSFHRYSFGNILLIRSRRPDATRVAGFHRWRELGRSVRKGERGIPILCPRVRKLDPDAEAKRRILGFGIGYVFDVSQTDGAPLPKPPAWRDQGPARAGDIERIAESIRRRGIRLSLGRAAVDDRIPGADGVTYRDGPGLAIAVRDDFDPAHTVHTLLHELGHAELHFGADRPPSREQRELEADAVALGVAAILGYDFGMTTCAYLAGRNATPAPLAEALPRIPAAVKAVLSQLGATAIDEADCRQHHAFDPHARNGVA